MIAFVLSAALAAAPVPPDKKADEEFVKKVDAARLKAIKYLKDKQDANGGWDGGALKALADMDGGATALAALGLMEAGVPANDPAVAKAVEYLLKIKPERTYVVSLQTQVLARADAKKYAKEIQTNADWLLANAVTKNDKLAGWSYPGNTITDGSNTHFALMGLHAAAQAGAKVDPRWWREVRDMYAATQHKTGGWTYASAGGSASHSMTVAGLLGLAVATKYDKDAKKPDPAFDKGMALLLGGKLGELGQGKSAFVGWMTTAELGRALGSEEFKAGEMTKRWYREGAEKVAKQQQVDGSFAYTGDAPGIDKTYPVISTAAGLYLLGSPAKK